MAKIPKTWKEHAEINIPKMIENFRDNGVYSMSYSEFSEAVGFFGKNGRPVSCIGTMLGCIGRAMLKVDEHVPCVTALIHDKKTKLPNDGLKEFIEGWDKMSVSDKKAIVEREKKKTKKYLEEGKFDIFLSKFKEQQNDFASSKLKARKNDSVEFSSQQKTGDYKIAVGVGIREHRESEYKIRDSKSVAIKKAESKCVCECCDFDFREKYGNLGDGYIECHHIKPLADTQAGGQIGLNDLAALCANCHRMIHKLLAGNIDKYENNYHLSLSDLREIINKSDSEKSE
ncbi:MAG: HNH endonuclease [Gammaproteobacteria bacterium]